jgi:hypothetical protein
MVCRQATRNWNTIIAIIRILKGQGDETSERRKVTAICAPATLVIAPTT